MGYTINSVVPKGTDEICVAVEFSGGQSGTVNFPLSSTEAEVLAKLDEIEAGYPTVAELQATLPVGLQNLVGYVKP